MRDPKASPPARQGGAADAGPAIRETLRLFVAPGQVTEIRPLFPATRGSKAGTRGRARCFADGDEAAAYAAELEAAGEASGLYFVPNAIRPGIDHRTSCADADVARRLWLYIDLDPERDAGICATDAEKAASVTRAAEIKAWLTARGWPEPIEGDSGNGRYLCYRLDLPNDDAAADLIRDVLQALSREFTDAAVKIDTSMFNASRIIRLFGTMNRKGPDSPERPHRRSGILRIPTDLTIVPTGLLEALAEEGRAPAAPTPAFDLEEEVERQRSAAAPAGTNGHAWVGMTVADDFNAKAKWPEVLKGWQICETRADGEVRWTRPGKRVEDGHSATTGHEGRDVFHVFSNEARPFAPNESYSKFQAYALLKHGGDESKAAAELYKAGYGTRQPPPPPGDDDRPEWHKDRAGDLDDLPPRPPTNGRARAEANGQAATPTPEPIDVAALRERAGEFQKLSDLTDDVGWLDALARLEVTDPDEANRILTFAQDVLGKKKWAAKPVKIAMAGPRKAARRLASHPPKPRTTLPEILVDRPIHEVIADAVDCLRADPEVFKRGPNLVRMIRNENPPKGLQDTEGTPQIAVIPATRLIELLSRSALWVRERTNQDGDPILVATDPTATHASLVKDRCDWPGIRILERVTEAPCLRTDGTILQEPGYDPDTGLFFLPHPGVTFPEIPEHPTIADARAAAKTLLDLVVDFPFTRPEGDEEKESLHTYAWLASLLTILCRSAIDGPCPLFLFTARRDRARRNSATSARSSPRAARCPGRITPTTTRRWPRSSSPSPSAASPSSSSTTSGRAAPWEGRRSTRRSPRPPSMAGSWARRR